MKMLKNLHLIQKHTSPAKCTTLVNFAGGSLHF